MRKPGPKLPAKRSRHRNDVHAPCLYLGCFIFDRFDERDTTGSFQIVVEATSPEQAVERCDARLRKLRATATLFKRPTIIYIEGIIKLAGSFKNGLLVNYDSGPSPSPPHWQIASLIPEQKAHDAVGYGWTPHKKGRKKPSENDESEGNLEPFLDFGGESARRAREKARAQEAAREQTSPSAYALAAQRTEAAAARDEAKARKKRRQALRSTLDELRGKPRS